MYVVWSEGILGTLGRTVPFPKYTHIPEGLGQHGKTIGSVCIVREAGVASNSLSLSRSKQQGF